MAMLAKVCFKATLTEFVLSKGFVACYDAQL